MTAQEFLAFYPQFGNVFPSVVISTFVNSANKRFSDLGDMAEEARRIYTAHKLTMYAKTFPAASGESGSSVSMAAIASAGDGTKISSKKVENVSVTYASSSGSSASGSLGELEETIYGRQLLSLLKLSARPRYLPG